MDAGSEEPAETVTCKLGYKGKIRFSSISTENTYQGTTCAKP
jgi:hypothetical protein